ncbi:MAG TPA: hypothetical protein VK550_12230 [Polyangiaceae bacterium]|nr:hypothetical protein [Polyangiaceae bacterium]
MKKRRIYHCVVVASSAAGGGLLLLLDSSTLPPHPLDDGVARPKWNSKWEFERAGERVQIVVVATGPTGQEETIDAREFIERLGENHQGTTFAIHVETEQIGAD